MTNKIIGVIAVLAILISGYSLYLSFASSPAAPSFGSVGVKLAENYDPYIRYNGGYYSLLPISTTGGITNTGTWTQGTNGTAITRVNTGTCFIKAYSATISATSTAQVDCQATQNDSSAISALAGVTYGDNVIATLGTSTAGTLGGLVLEGAAASSTSGYLTLYIANLTGTTYTWSTTAAATGTASYIVTH